ncbi:MAG: LPS export ABC transporter periplasmic protein LptC [Bacteroidia bacterium]|nr:LPS export ABC transporter periplasmic protein LptC [Bacteroidia bacterium]MCF8426948.1 LPS export ABC transporter periplasmic protein LptC [Bacteroidia bacterium]MCF8447779.1 LPS export ABC transporter periplasmic protein LptC [Bacteroidia bacterium]
MIKKLIFISLLSLLISCGNKETELVKISSNTKELPIEIGDNVTINYTDSGMLKAKLFAPILERYTSETRMETEMTEGITAYFYNSSGQVTSYIKSKYALRNEKERTITARNDVNVINNKGDTLRTEELIWDEKTDRIYSQKFVRITSPDKIIMGTGLESNTEFSKFRVLNITGIISLNP